MADNNFIFGRPVRPACPVADGQRSFFVLGAYPSAFHVKWHPPGLKRSIRAIAVDNEPEPFWTGDGENQLVEQWKRDVGFREGEWGRVSPCGNLNGPSGRWVEAMILHPLRVHRSEAWITDCLDTYYESEGAAGRMDSPEVVELVGRLGITPRRHASHPSERQIVEQAVVGHRTRLLNELRMADPDRVVTLGNAALIVFNRLIGSDSPMIQKLSPGSSYGQPLSVRINGRVVEWLPLAHPAAPAPYQEAHKAWITSMA